MNVKPRYVVVFPKFDSSVYGFFVLFINMAGLALENLSFLCKSLLNVNGRYKSKACIAFRKPVHELVLGQGAV